MAASTSSAGTSSGRSRPRSSRASSRATRRAGWLRPGAFPALFGVPADELVDLRVPAADVLRRPARLAELAADAPLPDPLAEAAMRSRDLAGLARDSGYSPRHLRRRALTATGLGPKRLQRIGWMQAALSAGRGESWARTRA